MLQVTTQKPKVPMLYTFGYLARSTERTMRELTSLSTRLVDIRYVAASKRWQYTGEVPNSKYGNLYYWISDLGNELYREALSGNFTEQDIKLHNPKVGTERLMSILERHGHAAIFCACSNYKHCHRKLVAEMMQQQYAVKIVHL